MQTAAHPSRDWLIQLAVLVLIAVLGTLPFWWTDLDTHMAALFYDPTAEDRWAGSSRPLWAFLYQAAPLIAGLILIGSLLTFAAALIWPSLRPRRRYAVLLMAATVLGPGLVVNGVFKDHWGRPRPHQTLALGGTQAYVPPLSHNAPGQGKGKSFPCGHSSVGYLLGVFFLIWRRRRPRLAWAALLGSITLGTLIGVARMSAGDHFLSDVIWSAVLAYGVAFLLYYVILRIPQRESATAAGPPPVARPLRHPTVTAAAYLLATGVLLFGVLVAIPVEETRNLEVQALADPPGPRTLRLVADTATITLFAIGDSADGRGPAASIRLKGRGFGLPTSRVRGNLGRAEGSLTYTVTHSGLFTEKDTTLTVGINPVAWERIEVQTTLGDIRIFPLGERRPRLILETRNGVVLDENRPGPGSQ
ncbi:MAG TPA: phosphatase PAP2 family protein [Lamprocystis sp. (in: g-proteobacteria)]|nr:phosphatase PAP2 family protein [Lamprocystis sp. (in: g-proteobacteria)]